MQNERTYDFSGTLGDLDAGIFLEKISRAVKETAIGTVAHGKKGKVVIELAMDRIGESSQITMTHKLKFDRPTKRGKVAEEDATETALYVSPRIGLSIMPDTQTDWLTANNANKEEA
jgi:hypothetical protein